MWSPSIWSSILVLRDVDGAVDGAGGAEVDGTVDGAGGTEVNGTVDGAGRAEETVTGGRGPL